MNTMSQKRDKNQREKEADRKVRAKAKHKKQPLTYVMSPDQSDKVEDIQRITQEELQYVLDNLKEYEGLTKEQIHGKVTIRVRKRCEEELGMEIGH